MTSAYDPNNYWRDRLTADYNEAGVGQVGVAASFNRVRYRAEQRVAARMLRGAAPIGSVLDIGPGTGVWIEFWRRRGVPRIVGMDLTAVAVRRLTEAFPYARFLQGDIADVDAEQLGRFDAISVMSVLLHITDEQRFRTAVANLAALLAPHGALLIVDPIVVHNWWGPAYTDEWSSRPRPLDEYRAAFAEHGLEIADLQPVTVLLCNPIDTRRPGTFRLLQMYWEGVIRRHIGRRERVGALAGSALGIVDQGLLAMHPAGPSMKCMLVRRPIDPDGAGERGSMPA